MKSLVRYRLEKQMRQRPATLLGLGPMSRTCVDAAIEVANQYNVPILLVASRRQVECAAQGGGYVEGWTTEDFATYVRRLDRNGNIILCRDHGGPWQGSGESSLSLPDAMDRAKQSFAADIDAGLSIIHIDPSVHPSGEAVPVNTVLDRVFELYHYCWQVAADLGRDIDFEIGTEEQTDVAGGLGDADGILQEITRFCEAFNMPMPLFDVLQTGTKVVEDRNVGSFASPWRIPTELPSEIQVPLAVDLLRQYGVYMKMHNSDYLDDEALSWMPRLGISAVNIAPEFGLLETRLWLKLMRENDATDLADGFLALAYQTKKWEKWLAPDSTARDVEKAVLAGHYVFSTPEFREIAEDAEQRLVSQGVSPRNIIRAEMKQAILRYIALFRLRH